eukprot:3990487-Alexandrium_andersonii.AAC.1
MQPGCSPDSIHIQSGPRPVSIRIRSKPGQCRSSPLRSQFVPVGVQLWLGDDNWAQSYHSRGRGTVRFVMAVSLTDEGRPC